MKVSGSLENQAGTSFILTSHKPESLKHRKVTGNAENEVEFCDSDRVTFGGDSGV